MNHGSESRTKVPRLRSRLRQATSDAILAAAEEAIGDKGLHAAGMGEIAARAGVSVGTLYNHFDDKDAMLAALIDVRRRDLRARIDTALGERQAEPFRAQLAAFTAALAAHFDLHRRFLRILWDEETARGAPLARRDSSPLAEVHERLEKLMRVGVREGALRREGATIFAIAFMGMAKVVLMRETRNGSSGANAAALMRLFLEGAGTRG
jgi:AcrR family transcriptional regulator